MPLRGFPFSRFAGRGRTQRLGKAGYAVALVWPALRPSESHLGCRLVNRWCPLERCRAGV